MSPSLKTRLTRAIGAAVLIATLLLAGAAPWGQPGGNRITTTTTTSR
jgi:hypothetical protein